MGYDRDYWLATLADTMNKKEHGTVQKPQKTLDKTKTEFRKILKQILLEI